nr:nucleoside recognition domain-containing protein [Aeromonas cavernicola]
MLGFGLLEFIGILMQPIMRPLWRTPGHSAIDAVASFVGSYSVGLIITNRVFLSGKYTVREAVIAATGFSTVSAAFMIIVAKTLNLMTFWNFYFWSTLVITFAITSRAGAGAADQWDGAPRKYRPAITRGNEPLASGSGDEITPSR